MDIDPSKLELLRTALPKGLSAGDSGLDSTKVLQPYSWPAFQSNVSESKLYTKTPAEFAAPEAIQTTTEQKHPFQINASDDFVTVEAGTINGVLAQNTFSGGVDLTEFSYSGLSYVVLTVNTNDGTISGSTLSIKSSVPSAQTAKANGLPSTFDVLIGVVFDGTSKQIITNNIAASGSALFSTSTPTSTKTYYVWTWVNA